MIIVGQLLPDEKVRKVIEEIAEEVGLRDFGRTYIKCFFLPRNWSISIR